MNETLLIVDVRTSFEYKSGCVPGALHMPFIVTPVKAFSLKKNKSQKLVIYCEHGPRAYFAAIFFKLAGFKDVNFLKGHMYTWRKRDLPLA